MVPDLRIEEHGRITELMRGRVALVTMTVVLALASLPVSGQEVESVEGGHRLGRSLPVCGRVEIGHGLLTVTALGTYALAGTALGVTGGGLLTATGHVVSVRVPLLAREVAVTGRGHAISRVDLVTARSHAIDDLPPLTARGLGRKDG